MKPVSFYKALKDACEVVLFIDTKKENHGLWSEIRVDYETLPKGWHAYDIRGNDYDGWAYEIENDIVLVNYCATLLTQKPIEFEKDPYHSGRFLPIILDEIEWSFYNSNEKESGKYAVAKSISKEKYEIWADVNREFHKMDAFWHLAEYLGLDPDNVSIDDIKDNSIYAESTAGNVICFCETLAERFEDVKDCSVPDNQTWEIVIRSVLKTIPCKQ